MGVWQSGRLSEASLTVTSRLELQQKNKKRPEPFLPLASGDSANQSGDHK